jgi:hypothetical protein
MPGFADRQFVPFDGKAGLGGSGLHHLDGFGDDFEANVVAEQNSDFQFITPELSPSLPGHLFSPRT